jgi:hypothetical protein
VAASGGTLLLLSITLFPPSIGIWSLPDDETYVLDSTRFSSKLV